MSEQNSYSTPPSLHPHERIKLNVGGRIFETTTSTLQSGGPDSLLAALSLRSNGYDSPVFIDRDPDVFSVLLSLLRSDHLPSTALRRFSLPDLLDEALYYGIDHRLRSATSPPPLSAVDASLSAVLRPASDPFPTAFSAAPDDGSLLIAHGGQISAFDWSLSPAGTVRTHADEISSLRRVWGETAAIGASSSPGLHLYDVAGGRHVGSVQWSDPSDPRVYKARVGALADSAESVFASFECPHRENCVLVVDKSTLRIVAEIGRQSGSSAKMMTPGKLAHLPDHGLLFGSAISCGAFGYSGYVRLWDLRSGDVVWETSEPGSGRSSRFGDPFADVDVDLTQSGIFKVCSKSGDLAVADLHKLGDDPWVYLEETNPSLRNSGGGSSVVLHCYRKQVFVSREAGLEVWSRLEDERREDMPICEGIYRRNFVDREEDAARGVIRRMEGSGDRLFVSREGVEGIEVWESSSSSAVISAD